MMSEEGYPQNWKHCKIHLNPETGEMHSDGDHSVRRWIEIRLAALAEKDVEVVAVEDRIKNHYSELVAALQADLRLWKGTAADEAMGLEAWKQEAEILQALVKPLQSEANRNIEELTRRDGINNPCKHTGFESVSCGICGYPDPRKLIAALETEICELRESRDYWKQQWGYMEAAQKQAEEEICRLRAEKRDEFCKGCALPERADTQSRVIIGCENAINAKNGRLKELEEFIPKPESINNLPEGVRTYIHNLATICDPSGMVQEIACLKDQQVAFIRRIKELEELWSGVQSMSTCTVEYQNELSQAKQRIKELTEASERIKVWCEGSTCEICGEKEMTDTDCYDIVNSVLVAK
jgi:hypothetical protein